MTAGVRDAAAGLHELQTWAADPTPRIPFGYDFFDRPTGGGIARSESCLVLAYSSVGKTALGLNVLRNNPGVPALFMSLEMSWRQVVSRLVAMETGMSTQQIEFKLRSGLSPQFAQAVADRYRNLLCDDTPAITLKDARESVRRATEIFGQVPRIIMWDYMELIGGSGLLNKSEAVDKAAQKLRDFHREFDTAGVVLHQVGKGSDTGGYKPLSLDDGKYGGHHPMDYVVGAYAPRLNPEFAANEAEFRRVQPEIYFQLLKNRSGTADPVGRRYRQDPVTTRIDPWEMGAQVSVPGRYMQDGLV